MEGQVHAHPGTVSLASRKQARALNLQKCDFCRRRKVRCEPQNRRWPDKCDHCERRGEECSPPGLATRRSRAVQRPKSSETALFSNQSLTEAPAALPRKESLDIQETDITLPGRTSGVGLTYQQIKDVVTVLRCHHKEYHVEKSQMLWLEKSFRDKIPVEIDNMELLDKFKKRLLAVSRIQKLTLDHTRMMLESQAGKHSTTERMLICQLLVDLETSFSTSTSGMAAANFEQEFEFADDQRNLATLLCQTGDYNGALTLLHRIPCHQIGEQDLSRIVEIGTLLCARTKTIPEVLGTGDDPMYSAVFECMDVLVLPHNLIAKYPGHGNGFENFIKNSFIWPWTRRRIRTHLKDQPEAPMKVLETQLDFQFRDGFGHSFLHAAVFAQNDYDSLESFMPGLGSGQENTIAHMSTAWPSYAPGLTPLACSVSPLISRESSDVLKFLRGEETFNTLLEISNRGLCCGSSTGTTGHKFCALAFAIRSQKDEIVEAVIRKSTQQMVDLSTCCRWAMDWIPNIPLRIRGQLMVCT